MDAIAVIVRDVQRALTADDEVHRTADHAIAPTPPGREILERARASGASADADDLVAGGRQAGPRAVQRHAQIARVLARELRTGIEGEAERRRMRRQLDARQREAATRGGTRARRA